MTHDVLTGIVLVLVLGIGSQWLAWRVRVPSILLLLIVGFVAGPVTQIINPAGLQGDWVFAFVSISIGVILFEGGLSLKLSELREVGSAVFNLITIGVLVTWILGALGAYYIIGMNVSMSILLGSILTVTGPTVVIPLLRHVRPTGRVRAIAKWEGITIDPVGAILAVLVLDAILILNDAGAGSEVVGFGPIALHAMKGLLLTITTGIGVSIVAAGLLILLLKKRLVPDYLQSSVALAIVVGTFALSNMLQEESGLLEVTLLGVFMANQPYVSVRRISDFKEDLQVLLIASLFIVLSARLDTSALEFINIRTIVFMVGLILVVRPLAVWLSSIRTKLSAKEKTFLSWIAPRGIVAAAVASLFSFELADVFPQQAESLVPIVFLVIVGTVAVYGLTLSPLARYLGLANPNPTGVLILGSHVWARKIGTVLQDLGVKVIILDTNKKNIDQAKKSGLAAMVANAVSESVLDEIDLSGIRSFLAMTSNDDVNTLAALNFSEIFETHDVLQLEARDGNESERDGPSNLRGRRLFAHDVSFASINEMYDQGGQIQVIELHDALTFKMIDDQYVEDCLLLFIFRAGVVVVNSSDRALTPVSGDSIVILAPSLIEDKSEDPDSFFSGLVRDASVIELDEELNFAEIVDRAATQFAVKLPIASDRLAAGFIGIERSGAMPIANGVAVPHYRLIDIDKPELLVLRCANGVDLGEGIGEGAKGLVYAIFFLVSPEERQGQHLRTLAKLAGRIDDEKFISSWRNATDVQLLKESILNPDHFIHHETSEKPDVFVGQSVAEIAQTHKVSVLLLCRGDSVVLPDAQTIMKVGDALTLTGAVRDVMRLKQHLQAGPAKSS